eukprot:6494794-Prymnesium_polylepis.1
MAANIRSSKDLAALRVVARTRPARASTHHISAPSLRELLKPSIMTSAWAGEAFKVINAAHERAHP